MDIAMLQNIFEIETWIRIVEELGWIGPFIGIAMTIIEAIFPPLPLALFVTLNVMLFGLWKGYILSWIGTCIGSILVFLLLRKIGAHRFEKIKNKYELVHKGTDWVHAKGGKAIFVLLCFPFTPSIAVAFLGAIADIETKTYMKAVIFGKLVMIFILSFIGYNIQISLTSPGRLVGIGAILVISYFISKKFLENHQKGYVKE